MDSVRSELNSLLVGKFRSRRSTSAGLFCILLAFLQAALAATVAELLLHVFPSMTILFRSLAVVFIGTRFRALGNMMHECAHGIFVQSPAANNRFGHLISIFDFSSFNEYMRQHVTHHAYLGNPEKDLDFKPRAQLLSDTRRRILRVFLIGFCCLSVLPLWCITLRPVVWTKTAPHWVNMNRLFLLLLTALLLLLEPTRSFIFLYAIVPFLTTYQWMKIFSDAADHLFRYGEENTLERSRNHLFPAQVLNWIFFPRNDGFHLLHHLFPSLPTYFYPQAHALLLSHAWYRDRSHHLLPLSWNPETAWPSEVQGQSK